MQIARLSLFGVNEKIAMCADPVWGRPFGPPLSQTPGTEIYKLKPLKCALARHAK